MGKRESWSRPTLSTSSEARRLPMGGSSSDQRWPRSDHQASLTSQTETVPYDGGGEGVQITRVCVSDQAQEHRSSRRKPHLLGRIPRWWALVLAIAVYGLGIVTALM